MIVELGGGKGGLKEYLQHGRKKGRELHRDQLDQRVPLVGDLDVFDLAVSSKDGSGDKYDHITLSFAESHVADEMLLLAATEFREHALAAWPESERHRIAFYAEAHRPRMLSYVNSETGERIARLTHIHIGLGKHDLLTGAAVEPLGFLGSGSDNLKYIDAWQESFNARHGFSSPKDNPKITPENAVDVLARYTGQRPDALGAFNGRKAALELNLQREIIAQDIATWDGFGKLLARHGVVSKVREGKFGECYRVKPNGQGRAMRLSGVFFQRQFIERPTIEKISIVSDRAKAAYLEQMQPRKEPAYVAETLMEWRHIKAREHRYLHTGSKFYQEVFRPADSRTRIQLLDQLERKHHGIQGPESTQSRKATATRSRVQKLPIRDLDGIQVRTEMLLRGDPGVDVRAVWRHEQDSASLRQAGERGGRFATGGPVTQPSSVLARHRADLRERYEQGADWERYAEIRRNLDCARLLTSLSHSHGLTPERYRVAQAKDGTPRIQCGSRSLTPNDFLSKELGLPWREASPILRSVYEKQIGIDVSPVSKGSVPSKLWKEFKAEQLLRQPAQAALLKSFDAETKLLRTSLHGALKFEQTEALAGMSGGAKKSALALGKLSSAIAKARFSERRREERISLQPLQTQAWRLFLQVQAQGGNGEALAALRKLDESARGVPAQAITGAVYLGDDDEEKKRLSRGRQKSSEILKTLTHRVELNGDVTYSRDGRAVVRDEGRHIAVLDQNSEQAIVAGLLLAREKFGTNLTLKGGAEFQRRVVEVTVAQGILVQFDDPKLQALCRQLLADKYPVPPYREEQSHGKERTSYARSQSASESDDERKRIPVARPPDGELPSSQIAQQQSLAGRRDDLVAQLQGQGLEVREIMEGKHFLGKIRRTTDHFVVQGVGANAVVIHELDRLGGIYVVGQDAHIQYVNGRGKSKIQGTERGKQGSER
jgi:hypothetical protein